MLNIIYIFKEFKEYPTGFWIFKFRYKLHIVWEADSHVVLDNWILCLVDMPVREYYTGVIDPSAPSQG